MVDIHILTQCIIHFCLFATGFIVAVPIEVNGVNFEGDCVLYASTEWSGVHFTMHGSNPSNCNFPIYYSVLGMAFYGLPHGLLYAFRTYKSIRNPSTGYEMWVLIPIGLNGVHALLSLIVSCMISVGYLEFCNGITKKESVTSCDHFANTEWKRSGTDDNFNAGPYTALLSLAMIASWIGFFLFLCQTALCVLRLVRNRRRQRKGATEVFNTGVNSDTKRIAELKPTA